MAHVIVDGQFINYQRRGSGAVIVLLHGWGDRASGLAAIYNDLSHKYHVIAPDLPGFGDSDIPKNQPWDLGHYATIVKHFLDKIGVKDVYAFIGHSNGGAIAIWGVANDVLSCERLVLLAASGVRNTDQQLSLKKIVFNYGKSVAKFLPLRTQKKLRKYIYERSGSDLLVVPALEPTFRVIVAQDIREEAKNIHVPTLLIYGQNDQSTPVEYGKILFENITSSSMQVIDAGHFVHLDQPSYTVQAINAFLENEES